MKRPTRNRRRVYRYAAFADPLVYGQEIPEIPSEQNETVEREIPLGQATKERSFIVPLQQTLTAGFGVASIWTGITVISHMDDKPGAIPWWVLLPIELILTPLIGFAIFAFHNGLLTIKETIWPDKPEKEKEKPRGDRTVLIVAKRDKEHLKGRGEDRFDLPDSQRWRAFMQTVIYNDAPFTVREAAKWEIPRNNSRKMGTWGYTGMRKVLIKYGYAERDRDRTTHLTTVGYTKLEQVYPPTL